MRPVTTATLILRVAALLAQPVVMVAHPGIDEQLGRLAEQMEEDPSDATLHLRRGNLFRLAGNWEAALAEYEQAAWYDPRLDAVDLERGQLFLEAGRPVSAGPFLNRFLARHPTHPEALLARARTRVALGQTAAAAADFTRAIDSIPLATPEHYLEWARTLSAAGRHDAAIRGLDAGLVRLGQVSVLQRTAIDIEVKRGNYDEALNRVERLVTQSKHPEAWLAWRGDILILAGRTTEARRALWAALEALESRPPHRRSAKRIRELELHIHVTLDGLRDGPRASVD
jgi:tetratricopeptide (TPR) repeat protein